MKKRSIFVLAMALCLWIGPSPVGSLSGASARSAFPEPSMARTILSGTTRHREWVNIPFGSASMSAFLVYPERADKAPSVLVTVKNEIPNVEARAVADQLAAEGFISIVPDVRTGAAVAAAYVVQLPAANGKAARLDLDFDNRRALVSFVASGRVAAKDLRLTASTWPQVVGQLSMLLMPESAPQAGGNAAPRMIPGLGDKPADLPAGYYTATATLARSKVKKEWVDIPLGDVMLHAWVEYPAGNGKTGVVIVMQHAVGLDDWTRSVADQLAQQGFIAVAPDPWSGIGPNGGNRDSFEFDDDAMKAAAQITADETIRRYKAAREWALKLPRANGKSGSIGFCAGGNNSFRFAGEVPDLSAAVVFYGVVPSQDLAAKINAPVLGFYGENDARVTSTVQPTVELMKKLGKSYEPHVYPKVTHSFVYFQDLSVNRDAVADAWPRTIAFFNKYLK
jgi:carboxymethylenebutenolidase